MALPRLAKSLTGWQGTVPAATLATSASSRRSSGLVRVIVWAELGFRHRAPGIGLEVKLTYQPDDVRALAQAIALELRETSEPAPTLPPVAEAGQPVFITRRQVVKRFAIDTKTLRAAEKAGQLECFRPGRRVLFRFADVVAFVESHKVAPAVKEPSDHVVEIDAFERARADRRRSGAG